MFDLSSPSTNPQANQQLQADSNRRRRVICPSPNHHYCYYYKNVVKLLTLVLEISKEAIPREKKTPQQILIEIKKTHIMRCRLIARFYFTVCVVYHFQFQSTLSSMNAGSPYTTSAAPLSKREKDRRLCATARTKSRSEDRVPLAWLPSQCSRNCTVQRSTSRSD